MIAYIILSTEFDVTIWYPYATSNDLLRYYNVGDILHTHEIIRDHYTMVIF